MSWPSPPNPITAVIVTMPIVETVATRRPAKIAGSASGSSIRINLANGLYTMQSAASLKSRGRAQVKIGPLARGDSKRQRDDKTADQGDHGKDDVLLDGCQHVGDVGGQPVPVDPRVDDVQE